MDPGGGFGDEAFSDSGVGARRPMGVSDYVATIDRGLFKSGSLLSRVTAWRTSPAVK